MRLLQTLFHMMRADFLQRVRSYRFLAMLLFTIFLTYLFIPALSSIQIAGLQLGGYRGVYNSAWIGSMVTLLMGEFFNIFAFFLLKGTVELDRRTGVGQILAADDGVVEFQLEVGDDRAQIGVPASLSIAVHATLDVRRPFMNGSDRVSYSDVRVVMAVDADHHVAAEVVDDRGRDRDRPSRGDRGGRHERFGLRRTSSAARATAPSRRLRKSSLVSSTFPPVRSAARPGRGRACGHGA